MKKLALILLPLLLLLPVAAQSNPQTWNQAVTWNGATSTGNTGRSDAVRNVGQSSHFLYICSNAATTSSRVELDASFNGINFFPVSGTATPQGGSCQFLTTGGYFPWVELNVTTLVGVGGAISAFYSATSGVLPLAPTAPATPSDPCQDPAFAKQSTAVNVTSAGTAGLIEQTGIDTPTLDVCSIQFTATGTTPTAQFVTGNGLTCNVGPVVAATGTLAPTAGVPVSLMGPGTIISTTYNSVSGAGGDLCVVVGGTSPSIQGLITYVIH